METTTENNLTARAFAVLLCRMDACIESREWAQGLDYATAWTTCQRGNWMLWLLNRGTPLDAVANELLVCRLAREVVYLNSDSRVLACIEVREAWARGKATNAEREAARAAARDAGRAPGSDAAQDAALDAARAYFRGANTAAAAARQADIIRELVPMPSLSRHL